MDKEQINRIHDTLTEAIKKISTTVALIGTVQHDMMNNKEGTRLDTDQKVLYRAQVDLINSLISINYVLDHIDYGKLNG